MRTSLRLALALVAGLVAGCRTDMYDQPRFDPYDPTTLYKDGTSARPIPEGTISRGNLKADAHYYEGKVEGKHSDRIPFPVDRGVLVRGRERYMIYCSPCHGATGDGRGMIVQRGFSPPPSFHSDELIQMPVGRFYEVITKGHGAMYSYAARIPQRDRWMISAYIRALQLSQGAEVAELPEADRKALGEVRP